MTPLLSDVVVNGETISAESIAAEAQNHPAPRAKPGLAWTAAARALAIRALLLQEARRRGIEADPQMLGDDRQETAEEALIRQLLDQALVPAEPTDADMRACFEAEPGRWRAPTLYEAAHILFPVKPGDAAALAEARTAATTLLDELKRSPRSFDQLARKHSACPSRDAGGRLGQLISGDTVPEFEAALDALAEGELAGEPVATRYGLHIIRLDARALGDVLPFETVAPRIREMLEKAAWASAARDFVASLADNAEVSGVKLRAA